MAINYLNSIDLNKNELLQGVIENQPNDGAVGASPATGQIYYNTTDSELRQYNGTAWVSVGDLTALSPGIYIDIDDASGPIPTIKHELTSRTDSTSSLSPGYAGTFTAVDSVTTNTTGHITALNLKTVTMPPLESYTFSVTGDSGTPQVINSGDTLDIEGGTNISTVAGATDKVTINLDDSITLAGQLTVNGTGQSSFAGQVTIPQTPSADTDAASKHYVDQAVTGALNYQGGYNAATNTPNLDSNPSPNPIKKGWTYTVTADGLFFTEQVRVGDVLIAEIDAPTALTDWTTVESNIDLADLTTVGIGNVNAGTGISVAYSSGTATVTNTDTNSSNTDTGQITAGATSGTVTHNFGTTNVIVQTYRDKSTDNYPTVFCDVTRASDSVTATISATEPDDIIILVQKIG